MGCIILLLLIIALPTIYCLVVGGSIILWIQDHWDAIGLFSIVYVVLYYGIRFLRKPQAKNLFTFTRTPPPAKPYNRHHEYKSWTAKEWSEWKEKLQNKPPRPANQKLWTPEQVRDFQIESWLSLMEQVEKKK